ncbi:AfsR/SARP family transcriptional regulator [Streptomyces longisporoflavus]|uniref:AfsR/SARP family transcriptional regulator n=1 Tax=Streptomyces longisporoflavus TaxID=28044 RepID=UPI00167DACF6|nr:BTAD domain-containing putative transcriptional regulator [Streptomyces longisporoflavus]
MNIAFQVLGPVELRIDSQQIDLGPARQRSFLAALLIEPQQPVSINTLIDRVWAGHPPDGVRSVVYTYIARLRRILASAKPEGGHPIRLLRDSSGYRLDVTPGHVDLHRFRGRLARARAMDPHDPQRCHVLGEALELWKGEALAGLDNEWATRLRHSLQQLKNDALAEWAQAELHAGRSATVISELRYALLQEPLAELLHEQLIRALLHSGQQAEALSQYERARRVIADELGSDPGHGLRELHRQALNGTLPAPPESVHARAEAAAAPPHCTEEEHGARPREAAAPGPSLLPGNAADISGREKYLELIHRVYTEEGSRPRVLVLVGGAGVGKTALAVNVARGVGAHYPDGTLLVDLRGSGDRPLSGTTAVLRVLRAMGAEPGEGRDLDELVTLYQCGLRGRRMLLVLDDAADDGQILPLLSNEPGCGVLVTSRRPALRPVGARVLPVGPLSYEDSLQLLRDLIGEQRVRAEPAAARELVELCEGQPLPLRAVSNRLLARPHWSLRITVERALDEERRLDTLSYGSLDYAARLTGVYRQLTPMAAAVLARLGSRPASDAVSADQIMSGLSVEEAEEVLEQLVDAHLLDVAGVDSHGTVRYRIHGLRRLFARKMAEREEICAPVGR